jgi:nucleoside-diphosphate-sugar epimerase
MAAIAVVGTGGSIGARVARHLEARPVDLRCPDPRADRVIPELADADVVVNLGGPRVRRGLGWSDYFREHVGVTAIVVRSMRPGARLVHVSSTAVYGARGESLGRSSYETPTLFPSPGYACAKLAAEATARSLGAERAVEITVLRPSMVYGRGIDSALSTLRRLHGQGVRLRLVPTAVRQHLVHIDVLLRAIECACTRPALRDGGPLLIADSFVLTNADLAPRKGRGVELAADVRLAARANRAIRQAVGTSPGALEALAVLGLDNTFDVEPTWRALGIDVRAWDRAATFDSYWNA